MNYELEVGRSQPYYFNTLNGGRPPLVSGSGSSTLFTSSSGYSFPFFVNGYESSAFSLEVWWLPVSFSGSTPVVIIGHASEGVLWDGSRFILRIMGPNSTPIDATWTPTDIKAFLVVMTYSVSGSQLYIDGTQVASIDTTGIEFTATAGTQIQLNLNGTATGIYDSLALYTRALKAQEIKDHYLWGNEVPDATQIAMIKGANTWSLSYKDVELLDSFTYQSDNFPSGYFENTSLLDGNLAATTSAGGTWKQSVALSSLLTGSSAGVHLTYQGHGVTMDYSTDGTTWTPVENKTTILQDVNLVDIILMVRLTFPDTASWVSSLKIDVLANRIMAPLSGNRMLTFKSAAMDQTPGNQLDYQSDAGANIGSGGYATIEPDGATSPDNVKIIEFWAKTSGVAWLFRGNGVSLQVKSAGLVGFSAGLSLKVNNVSVSSDALNVSFGQWNHYQITLTAASNDALMMGDDGVTMYGLATYSSVVSNSYLSNIGAPSLRVSDTSGITVSENSPTIKIYAKSWSYVSSGR